MTNEQTIVITTINSPNKAITKFGELDGWSRVIVGDNKTPLPWNDDRCQFLAVEEQKKLPYAILKNLPFNHYCRKMIGYLYAMENGAKVIYDTDDDNIPYERWHQLPFEGTFDTTKENIGFVNVYKHYTESKIWPRGYPLQLVLDSFNDIEAVKEEHSIGIWQGLADDEPDVDAIYRLVINKPIKFDRKEPIVLNKGAICPFNSQNTFFRKELFSLLYLPAFVSFRFTDILRGYIAQPIMWSQNYLLGFFESTVFQERNPHNYLQDFKQEIECYLLAQDLPEIIEQSIKAQDSINDNLYNVYLNLHKNNIVPAEEISLLENWLLDINKLNKH